MPITQIQRMIKGKSLFPFAWERLVSPEPCRFMIGKDGIAAEIPLDSNAGRQPGQQVGISNTWDSMPPFPASVPYFHFHDHCQITECVSGQLIYIFGAQSVTLFPGDILIINAMTPHSWISSVPGTTRCQIGFYPNALNANTYSSCFLPYFKLLYSQHYPFLTIGPSHPYAESCRHCLEEIARAYASEHFSYDTVIHNQIFDLSVMLVLSLFNLDSNENSPLIIDQYINKIFDYIEQNLDKDLSIQMMAEHLGMNPSYFSYYFKKHLGITYKKYVTIQRVTKAAHLLQNSDQTIMQIMYECGFASLSAFYQAFSSIYTIPPSQFRKLHSLPSPLSNAGFGSMKIKKA